MPRLMPSLICRATASCIVVRLSHSPLLSVFRRSRGGTGDQRSGREYSFLSIKLCVDGVVITIEEYTDMDETSAPALSLGRRWESFASFVSNAHRTSDHGYRHPAATRPVAHDRLHFLKILKEATIPASFQNCRGS